MGTEDILLDQEKGFVQGQKTKKNLNILIVFFIIAIVALSYIIYSQFFNASNIKEGDTIRYVNVTQTITKYRNETKLMTEEISFQEIVDDPESHYGEKMSLIGSLTLKYIPEGSSGEWLRSVCDDYDNCITITYYGDTTIALSRMQEKYDSLFTKGAISEGVYNVTGWFSRKFDQARFETTNIEKTSRSMITVEYTVAYNETIQVEVLAD